VTGVQRVLFRSEEHFEELKKAYGVPKKDDLLISAVGTIGTIWIVNGNFEFYFKDGNLIQIKSSPNFNSIFMKSLLGELIDNYKKEMSTGTAYSALTIAGLKKMLVYDVPLELQNEFAAFVEQVDKSKVAVQKALDEAQTLFDSLMQEYFG
jgi:type I restriction enzyme S subunit